jgi:hypothetical protein
LSDTIVSFCRQRSFQPVAVERTSQLAMVQELVSLSHGVSMIPALARQLDQSNRRVYRSFAGRKPTRMLAVVWNPYRFESRLLKAFRERLRRSKGLQHAPEMTRPTKADLPAPAIKKAAANSSGRRVNGKNRSRKRQSDEAL